MTRYLMPILGSISATSPAYADWAVNMPVGVTDLSAEIYDLHMLVLGICTIAAVLTFGAMIYALVNFRKSRGAEAETWSHDTRAEVIWTTVPTLILIAMAVPAAQTLVKIEDNRNTEMTIKITGYQWKWHYEYIGEDLGFYSSLSEQSNAARRLGADADVYAVENYLLDVDRPLVVPVDTRIRYLITSNDVIHAWWVPEIAIKKDAVPGYINEGWFQVNEPGTYRGQCAELCGKDHGFMPVVLEVLPEDEYAAWLQAQKGGAVEAASASTATTG
ncbi:MAG: cytochrome c oxidase subunit II [Gammaproteobacteria bacterium]